MDDKYRLFTVKDAEGKHHNLYASGFQVDGPNLTLFKDNWQIAMFHNWQMIVDSDTYNDDRR